MHGSQMVRGELSTAHTGRPRKLQQSGLNITLKLRHSKLARQQTAVQFRILIYDSPIGPDTAHLDESFTTWHKPCDTSVNDKRMLT